MAQNVNLYDAALRITRDWLGAQTFVLAIAAAVAAVVLAAGAAHWSASRVAAPAAELDAALQVQRAAAQALAGQVETLRPDARLVAEVASAQATLEQRQAALRLLHAGGLGRPQGHAAALQAFARQSIDGLWLTGLVLHDDDMALRGRAVDASLIPAYVSRLRREAALQGRALRALDIRRPAPPAGAASAAAAGPAAADPWAGVVEFTLAGSAGAVVARREDAR